MFSIMSHHLTHPASYAWVTSIGCKPLGPGSLEVASTPVAWVAPLTSELGQRAGQLEAEHQHTGHREAGHLSHCHPQGCPLQSKITKNTKNAVINGVNKLG